MGPIGPKTPREDEPFLNIWVAPKLFGTKSIGQARIQRGAGVQGIRIPPLSFRRKLRWKLYKHR